MNFTGTAHGSAHTPSTLAWGPDLQPQAASSSPTHIPSPHCPWGESANLVGTPGLRSSLPSALRGPFSCPSSVPLSNAPSQGAFPQTSAAAKPPPQLHFPSFSLLLPSNLVFITLFTVFIIGLPWYNISSPRAGFCLFSAVFSRYRNGAWSQKAFNNFWLNK